MQRRLSTILVPVVAIAAMSSLTAGCSTVDNDVAARVNDTELTSDELTDLVDVFGQPDPTTGTVDATSGDVIRSTINTWVSVEALNAQFESDGAPLAEADLDAARTQLEGVPEFADTSTTVQDVLVRVVATSTTLDRVDDPQAALLEATANADIYVDPRFGQFEPTVGVIPLAVAPSLLDTPAAG